MECSCIQLWGIFLLLQIFLVVSIFCDVEFRYILHTLDHISDNNATFIFLSCSSCAILLFSFSILSAFFFLYLTTSNLSSPFSQLCSFVWFLSLDCLLLLLVYRFLVLSYYLLCWCCWSCSLSCYRSFCFLVFLTLAKRSYIDGYSFSALRKLNIFLVGMPTCSRASW